MVHYRVVATHKGQHLEYIVRAKNGQAAATEARRIARVEGMNRIFISKVETEFLLPVRPGGAKLTTDQINAEIGYILGDVPLYAREEDGRVILEDPSLGPLELGPIPSATLVAVALYEYAVTTGWTNEDMEEYLWLSLSPIGGH